MISAEGAGDYETSSRQTRRLETERRHAVERRDKTLLQVQDLERRLEIQVRWTPESDEWQAAAVLVDERRYRRALDELQGLVISRLLELAKVNMAGTGATFSFGVDFIWWPTLTLCNRLQNAQVDCQSPSSSVKGPQECHHPLQ